MRLIVQCNGVDWQDDYTRIADKARCYFQMKFWDWREKDEAVQDAMCFLLDDFRKRWEQGKEVVFTPRWCITPVIKGRTFAGSSQRGCPGFKKLERGAMPSDVVGRDSDKDWQLDFEEAMSQLTGDEQRIVRRFMEGHSLTEIGRQYQVNVSKVKEALKNLHSLL